MTTPLKDQVPLLPRHHAHFVPPGCQCRYEMQIESLMLLDWYGGAHIITPEEYFQAELSPDDS